ncbi:hypothetical protein EJ04DRAFT_514568 [Polyplosphaeria fusca]|uniref:Uncharacterized protein n=1 Tax=Polyplosphaeria fusca TaxID=682080 RepID=A0A9P4QS48_9PLEO|nr:hypothetical protein EJ04DRAFT_514568 [Polyplosphaeria fusca]
MLPTLALCLHSAHHTAIFAPHHPPHPPRAKFSGRLLFLPQPASAVGWGPDREKTAECPRPVRAGGDIRRARARGAR